MKFFITFVATLVLALHYYLIDYPLTLVVIGQYLGLLGMIFLGLWIEGHFTKLGKSAYEDMFWSFSIPYVILATGSMAAAFGFAFGVVYLLLNRNLKWMYVTLCIMFVL